MAWIYLNRVGLQETVTILDSKHFTEILAGRLDVEVSTARRLLEGFAGIVAEECGNLHRIALPLLGSFRGVKRNEVVVRDLSTGRRLLLPPAIEVEFSAAGRLKNGIAEGPKK